MLRMASSLGPSGRPLSSGYSLQCFLATAMVCFGVTAVQGLSLHRIASPEKETLDRLEDSFPSQPGDGIPLFMKILLWDSQAGSLFKGYRKPVLPPSPTTPSIEPRKSLAKSVAPTVVSVDSSGTLRLDFPPQDRRAELESWLVLAPRRGNLPADTDLTLAVFDISANHFRHRHHSDRRRLVSEDVLPNATFIAVDVTMAVRRERPDAPLRLLVDVTGGVAGSGRAADVLEVAGTDRGPLLLRTREALTEDGSIRVWREVPEELASPPQRRDRRHSSRSRRTTTTSTTTEGYSSAESPVRNRFNTDAVPDNREGGCETCHLQSYNVSVKDLKWDFLVYPDELPINLCEGVCPSPLINNHYNMTTNAIARSIIKSERLPGAADVPSPSCVPVRFTPFNVLIKSSGRIETISLEVINDLSAERCGCR